MNKNIFGVLPDKDQNRVFRNLIWQVSKRWWGTSQWWIQCLVWLLIINGTLALNIQLGKGQMDMVNDGIEVFIVYIFIFTALGISIWSQGAVVGEKQAGTAAWILSKPVSRSAFILSRGIAYYIAGVLIMIVLQSVIAYFQISFAAGSFLDIKSFLWIMLLASIHLLFYLSLTLMLGTFFENQGPVIGLIIAIMVGMELWDDLIAQFAPWLVETFPTTFRGMTTSIALGKESLHGTNLIPFVAMPIWALLFTALAIWRFQREEF